MRVTLAGLGCGAMATVTAEVGEALAQADYLIGAARLLRRLPVRSAGFPRPGTFL